MTVISSSSAWMSAADSAQVQLHELLHEFQPVKLFESCKRSMNLKFMDMGA